MRQTFNEKNRDLIVNINGELLHRDKARISPFDSVVCVKGMSTPVTLAPATEAAVTTAPVAAAVTSALSAFSSIEGTFVERVRDLNSSRNGCVPTVRERIGSYHSASSNY